MTAEIVIMNKQAIAIAADSAVTFSSTAQIPKIFTSANKIFALSKYHPVGIMVYSNANFMGVPWEIIIKLYRHKLGEDKFDTLGKYADDFINFLTKEGNLLFPESEQKNYFERNVYHYFYYYIKREIKQEIQNVINEKGEIIENDIEEIISKTIKKHYDIWEEAEFLPSISKVHPQYLLDNYKNIIIEAKKEIFENRLTEVLSNQLTKIAINLFVKFLMSSSDILVTSPDTSGIVITGFGEKDIFPSLKSFLIEGIINNQLKYKEDKYSKIDFENVTAEILPFAQKEMVFTFMAGVDPSYQMAIEKDLSEIFEQYPELIIDNIEKLDENEKKDLKEKSKEIAAEELKRYKEKLKNYRQENYINTIMGVVAMLPKDELAEMAEALVNLTSFKRKVSMGAETVGGPIDVAVISKGDGFIWIKRKHYFEREFNQQFFSNYYRGGRK